MNKKKMKTKNLLFLLWVFIISSALFTSSFRHFSNNNKLNNSNFNIRTGGLDYANATVISDGINDIIWNDGASSYPDIALDNSGNIHVVWTDDTDGIWDTDTEIMYASYSASTGWSVATVISDGYNDIYWNDDWSGVPDIAIDSSDNIHVVWTDYTGGIWGSDPEIMYVSYSTATGWSNVTVISDGYNNVYWNDYESSRPAIIIDNNDKIHVVWSDNSDGVWGYDWEIMYVSYTEASGWSNATVISDGYNNIYWNDASSWYPKIALDNSGGIHVVWEDDTDGIWDTDTEIMYVSYTDTSGWSNATVISDGHNNIYWNDGPSNSPDIAIDSSNTIHVVWDDDTDGAWGNDAEIMYTSCISSTGWSIPKVISDGYSNTFWNDGESINPSITDDPSGRIHVAWEDDTIGIWGGGDFVDEEIMYVNYTEADGWSNITVISDGYNSVYWNDDISRIVSIEADANNVHAVWSDETNGIWGFDAEIMYTSISLPKGAGEKGISFGNVHLLFILITILGLVVYLKKKSKI